MHKNSKNAFNIDAPNTRTCVVDSYTHAQSVLTIKVYGSAQLEFLKIVLAMVHYFSGPMRWTGAAFGIASDDECLTLLNKIKAINKPLDHGAVPDYLRERVAKAFSLYTLDAPEGEVRILASSNVFRHETGNHDKDSEEVDKAES